MADASYDEHDRLASNNSTQLDISVDQSFGEHTRRSTTSREENVPPSSSKRQKSTSATKRVLRVGARNEEKIATGSSGARRTSRRQVLSNLPTSAYVMVKRKVCFGVVLYFVLIVDCIVNPLWYLLTKLSYKLSGTLIKAICRASP